MNLNLNNYSKIIRKVNGSSAELYLVVFQRNLPKSLHLSLSVYARIATQSASGWLVSWNLLVPVKFAGSRWRRIPYKATTNHHILTGCTHNTGHCTAVIQKAQINREWRSSIMHIQLFGYLVAVATEVGFGV